MSKIDHDFGVGDHVVYPAHGVGVVQGVESQDIAGMKLELYVITFDHEKMTLRVPTAKIYQHWAESWICHKCGDIYHQA